MVPKPHTTSLICQLVASTTGSSTKETISHWKQLPHLSCEFCGSDTDSRDHILFSCPAIKQAWHSAWISVSLGMLETELLSLNGLLSMGSGDQFIPLSTCFIYVVWRKKKHMRLPAKAKICVKCESLHSMLVKTPSCFHYEIRP